MTESEGGEERAFCARKIFLTGASNHKERAVMSPTVQSVAVPSTSHFRMALGLALAALAAMACSDEESAGAPITLASETELFPGFDFSTGMQPAGAPVQASFSVTAKGAAKVSALAVASESALIGLPASGSVTIDGGFALVGELKIDISQLPSYEGPIPGIENVQIPIAGATPFDPFAIGKQVGARADIPASRLPGIPLPGGLPGELVIEVAEGSYVEIAFTATCAGSDGSEAGYSGSIDRSGSLVLRPLIEIEIPLIGKETYEIPAVTVDLALGSSDVHMSAAVSELADPSPEGDRVEGSCGNDGAGGASSSSSSGQGGSTTTTSTGGASCDSGQPGDYGSADAVCSDCLYCASQSACASQWAPCEAGTGQPCDVFLECIEGCDAQCGGDTTCFNDCLGQGAQGAAPGTCAGDHPIGFDEYASFLACGVCTACPINCTAQSYCS